MPKLEKTISTPRQTDVVRRAFDFAKAGHMKQKRRSGEDYIVHPLEVAKILTEMHLDDETIAAAVLHDTVEETGASTKDIEKSFGKEIAKLVRGVTKLNKLSFEGDREEYSIENLRQMFLAMSEDIRVVLIKLADRLHNMRSLAYLPQERQQQIARETLEIYGPVAERLCMGELRGTLEDLAFPYVYPEEYKWIKNHMTKAYQERNRLTGKVIRMIRKDLKKQKVELVNVHGRAKRLYSLYKKLLRNNMDVSQIYDLVAVRVVVKDINECYKTLGHIHQQWKPLSGRIKDYIATPKTNGYRSIHTTVISNLEDELVEIQIRTAQMHAEAEYGVAAHWHYQQEHTSSVKMGEDTKKWFQTLIQRNKGKGSFDNLPWIKQISQLGTTSKKPKDFINTLKTDILKYNIIVLTPRGDIKSLPIGSTPVDFAYSIHSDIGNSCIGAKINNRLVSLNVKIKNGDIVRIITSPAPRGPKREWLDFAVTTAARRKIMEWFQSMAQTESIKYGQEVLEDTLIDRFETSLKKTKRELNQARIKLHYDTVDEIYQAIGRGKITAHHVVDVMFPQADDKVGEFIVSGQKPTAVIKDNKKFWTKAAKCCHGHEGYPIIGIRKGNSITVHLKTCLNVTKVNTSSLVKVSWARSQSAKPQLELEIESYSRTGLVRDIAETLAIHDISILDFTIKYRSMDNSRLAASLLIESNKKDSPLEVLRTIRKINGIISAKVNRAKNQQSGEQRHSAPPEKNNQSE